MTKRTPCKTPGCNKLGAFHGHCKMDFAATFGLSWEDYLKNKAARGEDPHAVAARLKGADVSEEGTVGNAGSSDQPPPSPTDTAFATAVIFPKELWDRVSEMAEKEYRTTGQQILYVVSRALDGHRDVTYLSIEVAGSTIEQSVRRMLHPKPESHATFVDR